MVDAPARETELSIWQRYWQQLKADLAGLVVVRRQDQAWYHTAVPGQQQQLQAILQLRLEMAQLALQTAQQEAWEQALEAAQQWLRAHFDPDSRTWQAIDDTLSELKTVTLQPALPSLDDSLMLIERLLLGSASESGHGVDQDMNGNQP